MSYVIQNFNESRRKLILTPRIKQLFFLLHVDKFIFFIKFSTLFSLASHLNTSIGSSNLIFIKYFFSKLHLKLLNSLNLQNVGFYLNNLIKSYVYLSFQKLNSSFETKFNLNFKKYSYFSNSYYFFNLYWAPIKLLRVRINNNFFKNVFFFLMFHASFLWYSHNSNIRFYLNFLIINRNLNINRFFGSYFLKIYNF